jgi:hypothetical protein
MNATLLSRLSWHAGLEGTDEGDQPSISASTLKANFSATSIGRATSDVVDLLEELNKDLNGSMPSESTNHAENIPRSLAYAMAEILRLLRDSQNDLPSQSNGLTSRSLWTIETAWNAVLAGDIDNLHEHLAYEEAARR